MEYLNTKAPKTAAGIGLAALALALVVLMSSSTSGPAPVHAQALPQIAVTATVTVGSDSDWKGFSAMASSSLGPSRSFGSISPTTFTYDSTTFTFQGVTYDKDDNKFTLYITPCPTSAQEDGFGSIIPDSSNSSPPDAIEFTYVNQRTDNDDVCHLALATDEDVTTDSNSGFDISDNSTVDFTLLLDYPSSTAQANSHHPRLLQLQPP